MMQKHARRWLPALCLCLGAAAARGAEPVKPEGPPDLVPPVTQVFTATRAYPVMTLALTNHAGWTESRAYVNVPQDVKIAWHVNHGGEAVLDGRDAWDPSAPWRPLDKWDGSTKAGEKALSISTPTLLRLRVRAPRFPRSGIARLRAEYVRHTLAGLRGNPGTDRRPVILAEGYDPFNTQELNDNGGGDAELSRFFAAARKRYGLDLFLLDWGDGGAPLEQQAEDFAEIARQVKGWNGGRRGTVAAGLSMGAVSVQCALAKAADGGRELGVQKYISLNGPHQGAWINPDLLKFLLKQAARNPAKEPAESSEAFLIRRGLDNPAAQELLIPGARHDAFYKQLHELGTKGYDPGIPRVAFSNGTLVSDSKELEDLAAGKADTIHKVLVKPLWLPIWVTMHRTRRDFRYGSYPGELLPQSLRQPVSEHIRLFGVFRFDFRARWTGIPTFIPTHSALDFPETLEGGPRRYHYTSWRQSAFPRMYVSRSRNLAHDETGVDWVDPRTGQGAPAGENAVLWEAAQAFSGK